MLSAAGIFGSISSARRAASAASLGRAGQPQHLAEIGVKQRDLRRELDRTLHVLDCFAELAVLMRDDAEEMFGLGAVRLGLEEAAAQRFGLTKAPLGQTSLSLLKSFRNRNSLRVSATSNLLHSPALTHAPN